MPNTEIAPDYLTELMRLVEQQHQRIVDLEHRQEQFKDELAAERELRRNLSARIDRLSNRIDHVEMSRP